MAKHWDSGFESQANHESGLHSRVLLCFVLRCTGRMTLLSARYYKLLAWHKASVEQVTDLIRKGWSIQATKNAV